MDDQQMELLEYFLKWKSHRDSTTNREYWQGKKDGLRIAMTIMGNQNWADVNKGPTDEPITAEWVKSVGGFNTGDGYAIPFRAGASDSLGAIFTGEEQE